MKTLLHAEHVLLFDFYSGRFPIYEDDMVQDQRLRLLMTIEIRAIFYITCNDINRWRPYVSTTYAFYLFWRLAESLNCCAVLAYSVHMIGTTTIPIEDQQRCNNLRIVFQDDSNELQTNNKHIFSNVDKSYFCDNLT
jgi:aspartate/methionine/tyrosine aminotransferase